MLLFMLDESLDTWICNQEINSEYSNSPMRIQVYILATGVVYFVFAYLVPTMSAMRNWLSTSAVLTIIYYAALTAILIKDGTQFLSLSTGHYLIKKNQPIRTMFLLPRLFWNESFIYLLPAFWCVTSNEGRRNETKDYRIHGDEVEKVFNAFGALAAILFCNTSGMLPEIQVGWRTTSSYTSNISCTAYE